MSYDIYLEADTGGPEPVEVFWRNHTSNTAVMWRKAGCDLAEFDGKPATELAGALAPALAEIEENRERYARQWNPPNGWGSVETTIEFLTAILDGCRAHPLTTVRVCR